MAEEFLNRLNGLEKKIDGLGETLMRMITILGNVTDLKSDLTIVKQEVLDSIKGIPQPVAPAPGVTKGEMVEIMSALPKLEASGGGSGVSTEEVSQVVKAELAGVLEQVLLSIAELRDEVNTKIEGISGTVSATPVAPAAAPAPIDTEEPAPVMTGAPVSADRGMQVADQLENILGTLKMGCKAGDVLDGMNDAKEEIMKIVPSDPIMVKIDKWAGIVGTYSKRHELQAKDILKLKKDLRAEIPKYRPA